MKDNRKANESSNQYVVGQTMADYVADRLRMDIIQKRIPADSIITVKDISERYNVSLMPVRDAFHTLKGERFLEVVPYKHVKVLRIDREYVSNVYDFARAIECLLIEDLLENGDEALYTELERINNRMRRLSDEEYIDPEELTQLNTQFHTLLYSTSRNAVAKHYFTYYSDTILNALRTEYKVEQSRLKSMVEEHEALIEAARAGDLEKLQKSMTKHCIDAKNDFLKNDL